MEELDKSMGGNSSMVSRFVSKIGFGLKTKVKVKTKELANKTLDYEQDSKGEGSGRLTITEMSGKAYFDKPSSRKMLRNDSSDGEGWTNYVKRIEDKLPLPPHK